MSKLRPLRRNQIGGVSLYVSIIISMVMMVIAVTFARLMGTGQAQAIDSQLSTQASYAAETGINDVRYKILTFFDDARRAGRAPTIPSNYNQDCQTPQALGLTPLSQTGMSYTCIDTDLMPDTLHYDKITPDRSLNLFLDPVQATNTNYGRMDKLAIEWKNHDDRTNNFDPVGSTELFPNLPDAGDWNYSASVLRIQLTRLKTEADGPGNERDWQRDNTRVFFVYPSQQPTTPNPDVSWVGGCDATLQARFDSKIETRSAGNTVACVNRDSNAGSRRTLTDGAIVKANCVTICTVNLVDLASGVAEPANAVEARQNQLRFFVRITPVYSTSRVILRGYQGTDVGTRNAGISNVQHTYSHASGDFVQLDNGDVWQVSYPPRKLSVLEINNLDITNTGSLISNDTYPNPTSSFDYVHSMDCHTGAYAVYMNSSSTIVVNGKNVDVWRVDISTPSKLSQSALNSLNLRTCADRDGNLRSWNHGYWVIARRHWKSRGYHFPHIQNTGTNYSLVGVWRASASNNYALYWQGSNSYPTPSSGNVRRFDIWKVDLNVNNTPPRQATSSEINALVIGTNGFSTNNITSTATTSPSWSQTDRVIQTTNRQNNNSGTFNAETIAPYEPLRFRYIQAIIRVTGHASDVRVRIEERIPLRPTFAVPENAIHTAGTLCKLLTADNAGVGSNYEPSLLPTGLPSKWLSYLDQECNVYQ